MDEWIEPPKGMKTWQLYEAHPLLFPDHLPKGWLCTPTSLITSFSSSSFQCSMILFLHFSCLPGSTLLCLSPVILIFHLSQIQKLQHWRKKNKKGTLQKSRVSKIRQFSNHLSFLFYDSQVLMIPQIQLCIKPSNYETPFSLSPVSETNITRRVLEHPTME